MKIRPRQTGPYHFNHIIKAIMLPRSIRKKITLGFVFLQIGITAIALLTYRIVLDVRQRLEYVEIIDDFLNTTLEVRRFEKNYFLYGKESDFRDNILFVDKLENLALKNIKLLSNLMNRESFNELWDSVTEYKEKMQEFRALNARIGKDPALAAERPQLEDKIRSFGKWLTLQAEATSKTERDKIRSLLKTTGTFLFFSVPVFVLLCIILAAYLGHDVVSSLKILEEHTKRISKGDFTLNPVQVADAEINTLLKAFNRMTNELKTRQRQLVQSEKLASLGTLLSGVAHELNNPLSNVSSSAQILAEEIEDPDIEFKKNLLDQILEQSDRARDIVRSLLEFSRMRDFTRQEILLKDLFEKTIILLRGQMSGQIEVVLDIPEDLKVWADKQRMQQVFLNLIKNAVDVLGDDGRIWISCRSISKGKTNREIEILIEDNGPGIPPEILDKIFDPFFTTKDVGHGSGLGLFIVHDIIEMHGGSLRIDSRPGEGTTFIIWLPDVPGEKT